jgi:hypothetical protein
MLWPFYIACWGGGTNIEGVRVFNLCLIGRSCTYPRDNEVVVLFMKVFVFVRDGYFAVKSLEVTLIIDLNSGVFFPEN